MSDSERPINTGHAFCSLILPGLGQLLQKRIGAAVGFFILFLMSGFLPGLIITTLFMNQFSHEPLRVNLLRIAVFGGLFLLFMAAILWAALNAAWQPKKKQEEIKEEKPEEKKQNPARFTLVEFLVVIAIIGVLIAVLSPAAQRPSEPARRMQCGYKLHQIGIALQNYHETYGSLPPAFTVDKNGRSLHSWRVLLLPFLEQRDLYEKIRLDEPWDSEYNQQFHSIQIGPNRDDPFQCPSAGLPGRFSRGKSTLTTDLNCYYSVVTGVNTPFPGAESTGFADMEKETKDIVFVVERLMPVCWMDPNNEIRFSLACDGINRKLEGIGSAHPAGVNVVYGDASVRFISNTIDPDEWKELLMRLPHPGTAANTPPSPAP